MTPDCAELLRSLQQRGVALWSEGERLCFFVAHSSLDDKDRAQLRQLKEPVMEILRQGDYPVEVPLLPRAKDQVIPLSPFQLRYWHAYRHNPDTIVRTSLIATRLQGRLDYGALSESLDQLVDRHEALRTRIACNGGAPRQEVEPRPRCQLDVDDLVNCHELTVANVAKERLEAFAEERLDLRFDRLFAIRLLKLHEGGHILVLALNHLITDGVSNEIVFRELWSLYGQACDGRPASLPSSRVQFGDYAVWLARTERAWTRAHAPYWHTQLTGAQAVRLPTCVGDTEPSRKSTLYRIDFGEALSTKLRDLAQRHRTLPAVAVLTPFLVLAGHWCQRWDLLLRFTVNGRFLPQLESIVGLLATPLYLRIKIDSSCSLVEQLIQIDEQLKSGLDHFDFDRVSHLIPECAKTELNFNWMSGPIWTAHRPIESHGSTSVTYLPLQPARRLQFSPFFCDSERVIQGLIEYDASRLRQQTIDGFGRTLLAISRRFADSPQGRIDALLRDLPSLEPQSDTVSVHQR